MTTWQVDIDPDTGDATAQGGGHTFPTNTLVLAPHDGVHWKCARSGNDYDFTLEWSGAAPPVGVETDSWKTGKQKVHVLQHTRNEGTKKHFKYNVTVYDAGGSVRAHLDPDMVMDT
jgi:hypothetical protein